MNQQIRSHQIIFYNIHIDKPIAEEGDPFCHLVGVDGCGKNLLSIVYKQLGAETVQDQPQFNPAVLVPYKTSALMDNGPSGAGEFAVYFKDGLMGPEADGCMIIPILGETQGKFLIDVGIVNGTEG